MSTVQFEMKKNICTALEVCYLLW